MNASIQKYGPPVVVIAIALYLGWPPTPPMDLGDDVVRAKSVRWKVTDLTPPVLPTAITGDPFAEVLVDSKDQDSGKVAAAKEQEAAVLAGPTEHDLQQGLRLAGIAQTDHQRWAIINNRVCRRGDRLAVIGLDGVFAEIREIGVDQVSVAAGNLSTQIRPQPRTKTQPVVVANNQQANAQQRNQSVNEVDTQQDNHADESRDQAQSGNDPQEDLFRQAI